MSPRAAALAAVLLLAGTLPATAQSLTPGPPGPFVIDVRGVMLSVPQTGNYHPPVAETTRIPARGFGLGTGGHVYFTVKSARVGIGAEFVQTRGTATTLVISDSEDEDSGTGDPTGDDGVDTGGGGQGSGADRGPAKVAVSMRVLTPQVSLNWGTEAGWSYISLGAGRATVRSTATGSERGRVETRVTDVTIGGGARWFVNRHVGVGFDIRLHQLGSRGLFSASAGISLK